MGGVKSKLVQVTAADVLPKKRLIIRIGGLEKEGKTHFALTAPDPIALFNLDRGLEGVLDKFVGMGKEIHVAEFKPHRVPAGSVDDVIAANLPIWKEIQEEYYNALDTDKYRSLVIDTDTKMYEIARLALFGKLTQVKSHHYTLLNDQYRALVDRAYDCDKNVIFISKLKKQYKDNSKGDSAWTGKHEESGFTDLGYNTMVNLRARIDIEGDNYIEVLNCRANRDMRGNQYFSNASQDDANFATVAADVYPDYDDFDIVGWLS